jgi:DNA primase
MDVLALLDSKGIDYEHKGGAEYAIICPNQHNHHGGVDAKPSFNINAEKLVSHCFACGFSLSWAGLTKWLMGEDLDEFQTAALNLRGKLKRIAEHDTPNLLLEADDEFTMVPPSTPFRQEYRGIAASTYDLLDARHCTVGRYADRIFFKIEMDGKLLGIDARALKQGMVPKYLRPKGCNAKQWLFPYDLAKQQKVRRVVLCEGLFHAVNYLDKMGGPEAQCYFGGHNFSSDNVVQLLGLGIEEVIVFPDNDKAGITAMKKICPMTAEWLPTYYVPPEVLPILDVSAQGDVLYKDLGDMSQAEIEECLSYRQKWK